MRCLSILCCLAVLCGPLNAQEAPTAKPASAEVRAEGPRLIYQVDVVEFALKDKADAELDSDKF